MDDRLKGRKNICMMTKTCWALRKVLCSFLFAAVGLWTLNANMLHVQAETAGNVIYAFEKTDEVSIPVKASTDNIIYALRKQVNNNITIVIRRRLFNFQIPIFQQNHRSIINTC